MAISSLDDYINSSKQILTFSKAARTTVAFNWFSLFDLAGNWGAGTLAGTSTTNGVVPTDSTAGFPIINFSSGLGYLATVDFGNTVACRMAISDCLFKAGAYAYNSGTTTLSAQPSYSSRIPGGTDYSGLQIWIEVSTAFATGSLWQVAVTYTNQAGTTGRSTGATATMGTAALTLGKRFQMPLQAGDTGVQKIESVIVTTGGMTAGAFNVLVLRPLWSGRCQVPGGGDCHGLDRTGLVQVWTDSAIDVMTCPDSTSSGVPDIAIEIASL